MLNQYINEAILLHSSTIENAVLDIIEAGDYRTFGLLEDIVSECTLYLIETALPKFHGPRYGLAKFIKTTCRFKTINMIAKHEHARADMTGDFESFEGCDLSPSNAMERKVQADALRAALKTLKSPERKLAKMLFDGKTATQAAKKLKISQATVSRQRKQVGAQLAEALAA